MKSLILLIVSILALSCGVIKYNPTKESDFTILLVPRVNNDTVSLSVGGVEIFKNRIIKYDAVQGLPTLGVSKKHHTLTLLDSIDKSMDATGISNSDTMIVDLKVNKHSHRLFLPLNKGRFIIIKYRLFINEVSVEQIKRKHRL